MPVVPISLENLKGSNSNQHGDQLRSWCAALESGAVLYFPQTPLPIPEPDLELLLGQKQTGSKVHKNIAYKPNRDELTGVDSSNTDADDRAGSARHHAALLGLVEDFLAGFLAPYSKRWTLDYASYRPLEEQGRDLSLRKRNDLLHTDAFPTRPTRGWRILRFFHNIHPTRTRDWVVGEAFPRVVGNFTPSPLPVPRADSAPARAGNRSRRPPGSPNSCRSGSARRTTTS